MKYIKVWFLKHKYFLITCILRIIIGGKGIKVIGRSDKTSKNVLLKLAILTHLLAFNTVTFTSYQMIFHVKIVV